MSTIEASSAIGNEAERSAAEICTINLSSFDQRRYRDLVAARRETIRRVVGKLKPVLQLASGLDAGCGVGLLSRTLAEDGLNVCAFDGLLENIAEARRRYPELAFETADIEERNILQLGSFDLVLCCGLLQRVENPLLAIRRLRQLTGRCLLLESMCIPQERASLLLWEKSREDGTNATDVAWYPSESSLLKMLYRAGFLIVYRITPLPDHEDFREASEQARRRTILLASTVPIDLAGFRLCPEPHDARDPWKKEPPVQLNLRKRVQQFLAASPRRQYISMAVRARQLWPKMPIPLRLPMGVWWLAEKGALDDELMYRSFEDAERRFVNRLLRPGMIVVDIGAHHGLYAVLASKLVGRAGRVIAFEPSPRECRRLHRHLRLNRCRNVAVQPYAVADASGDAELYVVKGFRDWGNSLRPPAVPEPTRKVGVKVCRLDDVLAEHGIDRVDFIKLDAEGAELAVLKGARGLLQKDLRPAILVEVQDLRTRAWSYAAREITQLLDAWNYRWFSIGETGDLHAASANDSSYDANLVALPQERVEEFHNLVREREARW